MTSYRPCCVIPNYNHAAGFEKVIQHLVQLKLAVFIVNDGSNSPTTALLTKLSRDYTGVSHIHLPQNQGKGAAVVTGLQYAQQAGYSHALQIDADGQHDLEDVEKFISESENNPLAVITGTPVYDKSAPLRRVIPRYITHFWVWVETLSFTIKDSMCGFRIYPLAATIALIDSQSLGKRMDFDTEILVRLYWQSVEIIAIPTTVIYPDDGSSHFQLFNDNWLITKMHTRLFFGMLRRIPKLISLHSRSSEQDLITKATDKPKHWSDFKERGSLLAITSLFWIYRIFGRRLILLVLHPVILYFTLTSSEAARSSKQYFRQLAEYQGREQAVGWRITYNHFYQFAVSALDKIGSWSGQIKRSDVTIHGEEIFDDLVRSKKGGVIIGSHLGNLELCRALGEQDDRFKANAIVFNKNALKFQKVLSKSNSNVDLNLIHVERINVDTAIVLKQKVDQGEAVVIVGDRTSVTSVGRVEYADFLGKSAPFSKGPFILAGLLECPVYLLFCLKQASGYHVYFEPFADSLKFPRKDRQQLMTEKIRQYAQRLTYYCQKAPYQWFNFYDFWQADDPYEIGRTNTEENSDAKVTRKRRNRKTSNFITSDQVSKQADVKDSINEET